MDLSSLNRVLNPLRRLVDNMVARCIVRLVNDGAKMQALQISIQDAETRDACEHVQNYGFTAHPLPGAEGVVVFVGGRREHPLVIAVDDRRYRKLNLEAGEVAVFNHEGSYVHLKNDGKIEVYAAAEVALRTDDSSIVLAGENITFTGANIALASTTLTHNGQNIGSTHVHGGILPGGSDTSTPH